MMSERVLCLDLGSTFTKGALFELSAGALPRVLSAARETTCRDNLGHAAARVLRRLLDKPDGTAWPAMSGMPLYATSSAKGGLSILAVGLVPDLTLKAATLAACSAGGRVIGARAYGLTDDDLALLAEEPPDLVLLTGGTDGGNERYNLENARRLASSRYPGCVVFAGNARQRGEIARRLAGRDVHVTENLMPEVGVLNIEPARTLIRDLFLRRIVEGKGLGEVAGRCAAPIRPTPAAVYDLVAAMGGQPGGDQILLVDMGGATTDVYSAAPACSGDPDVLLKGLPEPYVKRSVEGDLGMRLNAAAVAAAAPGDVSAAWAAAGMDPVPFRAYLESCRREPGRLPEGDAERRFDAWLAGQCLREAIRRHAGEQQTAFTAAGRVRVQRGKDLRRVVRIIGSGGYLAARRETELVWKALADIRRNSAGEALVPEDPEIWFDGQYRLPAAAALTARDPALAARLFSESLSSGEGV